MVEFFLIVFMYIFAPIFVGYFFILIAFFFASVLGIGISFAFPIIVVLLALGLVSFIKKNRKTMPQSEYIRSLVIRIICVCCVLLFFVYQYIQTNSFNKNLEGKTFRCGYDELTTGFWIQYTYITLSFNDSENCSVYQYTRIGPYENNNELPGDFVGDYKYTLVRLINGNYAVLMNKHIYCLKAEKNIPKGLYYSIFDGF